MPKVELFSTVLYYKDHEYHRGDEVDIEDADHVRALEAHGAVGEVGTLAKLAKERDEADAKAAERALEAQKISDEEAARKTAHAQDLLANVASSDGPRVEKRDSGPGRRR